MSDRQTRSKWRTVLNVVGVLLLVAVVVPFAAYAVPGAIGAEHSYVVLSGSMEPTLSPGDVIFVNGVDPDRLERGDVITFTRNGESVPTTHRIVEIVQRENGVAYRTKGDNNEDPDQALVRPSQVQGKLLTIGGVPVVIPLLGYLIQFTATQTGFVLLALGSFGLLVVSEIWSVVAAATGTRKAGSDDPAPPEDPAPVDDPASPEDPAPVDDPAPDGATHRDDSVPAGYTATEDTTRPDEGTNPTAEASTPTGVGETDSDDESSGAVTFEARELQLGIAVLGPFLAYTVVVATVVTEPWSIGVAASVAAAFLLLSGLYVSGRRGGDTSASAATAGDTPAESVAADERTDDPSGVPSDDRSAASDEVIGTPSDDTSAASDDPSGVPSDDGSAASDDPSGVPSEGGSPVSDVNDDRRGAAATDGSGGDHGEAVGSNGTAPDGPGNDGAGDGETDSGGPGPTDGGTDDG